MGSSLAHVMVVGGTRAEWAAIDDEQWQRLAHDLAGVVVAAGGSWLTFRAYESGDTASPTDSPPRRRVLEGEACTVVIDAMSDGRERFAEAMRRLPGGLAVDEKSVAGVLYEPADVEPDLVVVLGPPTRLPPSLVWELAYGELVFLARPLVDLVGADLEDAIADFHGRARRFGGLEA